MARAFHATWNAVALAIWLSYVGQIVLSSAAAFPRGWRQKTWWIVLGSAPYMSFSGLWLPVGPLVGWAFLIQERRDTRSENAGRNP